MKDDLLHAQETVDWAITQIEPFEKRLRAWLDANIYTFVKELPADVPNNVIIAQEKAPLPAAFSVEAGAYFNVIRSSLDILACNVAKRDMVLNPDDIYFPVARSAEAFAAHDYHGSPFVRQLSRTHREILESFKPYEGGNPELCALHHLDIVRKHKRLLSTYTRPQKFHITGWGLSNTFTPVSSPGFMDAGNGETVLGILAKGAAQPEIKYAAHVIINEAGAFKGVPVIGALHTCAGLAHTIINAFDI